MKGILLFATAFNSYFWSKNIGNRRIHFYLQQVFVVGAVNFYAELSPTLLVEVLGTFAFQASLASLTNHKVDKALSLFLFPSITCMAVILVQKVAWSCVIVAMFSMIGLLAGILTFYSLTLHDDAKMP